MDPTQIGLEAQKQQHHKSGRLDSVQFVFKCIAHPIHSRAILYILCYTIKYVTLTALVMKVFCEHFEYLNSLPDVRGAKSSSVMSSRLRLALWRACNSTNL